MKADFKVYGHGLTHQKNCGDWRRLAHNLGTSLFPVKTSNEQKPT